VKKIFLIFFSLLLFAHDKVIVAVRDYDYSTIGFLVAKEKGFYNHFILEVKFKKFENPLKALKEHKADIAIDNLLLYKYLKGEDFVLVDSFFKNAPFILYSKEKIDSLKELNKKSVAVKKEYFSYFKELFKAKKIDANLIVYNKNIKADAFLFSVFDNFKQGYFKKLLDTPDIAGVIGVASNNNKNDDYVTKIDMFINASLEGFRYAFLNKNEAKEIFREYKNVKIDRFNKKIIEKLYLKRDEFLDFFYQRYEILKYLFNLSKEIDSLLSYPSHILYFSKAQKELIKRAIRVCINPDWVPIEFWDNTGNPAGISIDILKFISKKYGLRFKFIKTKSWVESQKYLKEKKCDILPTAVITPARKKYAVFTTPYLIFDLFFINKLNSYFIPNIFFAKDKIFVRKEGSGLISYMKRHYPEIKIKTAPNFYEMFKIVESDDKYFTIATLPVFEYYKYKFNLFDLQISGVLDKKYMLRVAVRKDMEILREILDKVLIQISHNQKMEIYRKWTQIIPKKKIIDRSVIIKIIYIIIALVLIFAIIYFILEYKIKKATEELEENREFLKKIFESTQEGIVIVDENRKIVDINRQIERIFGFKREEVLNKDLLDFAFSLKDEVIKNFQIDHQDVKEYVYVLPNGEEKVLLVSSFWIKSNSLKYKVFLIYDITELKNKEKIILMQSKFAAMGEMIANIAHQWRQPLNALSLLISNCILNYKLKTLNDKEIEEFQKKASELIEYMSKTIDDFRNFLSPVKNKSLFSISKAIDKALEFMSSTLKKHNIKVIKDIKNIEICGVENELIQVLINIFNNSKDAFLNKEGEKFIKIKAYIKDDKVILDIEDNAGGVSKEILDRLAEPYFTTKFKSQGTGLGLYMSKTIIEKTFNGKLEISNIKNGLRVRIIIPLHQKCESK
jgi:PAS domain S-box-containing protein